MLVHVCVAEFHLTITFILTYYLGTRHSPQLSPTLSPTMGAIYQATVKPSNYERPNLLAIDCSYYEYFKVTT